jgi:predicted GIY-YIG superfamily endonuclease
VLAAATFGRQASLLPSYEAAKAAAMKYVYLPQSIQFPDQTYVGLIDNLRSRFSEHNRGRSPHTAKYTPWRLVSYVAFSSERKVIKFERYLKSASGQAFANKQLR